MGITKILNVKERIKMRELTKEELELAPSWATHYSFGNNNSLWFEGKNRCATVENNKLNVVIVGMGINENSKPIPRKPFNIKKHVFSDHIVSGCHLSNDLCVVFNACSHGLNLTKQDAIAIAKALGVTGEDL